MRRGSPQPEDRISYILSESFQLLDSYKPQHSERQEENHQGLEPTTRQSTLRDEENTEYQEQRDRRTRQEPFISSLIRSFHIVQRSQAWVNSHRDNNGAFHYLKPNTRLIVHTALHIAAYAVLGSLLRIFLVQLFSGGDCTPNNSDDATTPPRWLSRLQQSANLCIASDSKYDFSVFANLPANILGCFLMGLWQPSDDLGLATHIPIASLAERHFFQEWRLHHVGLRTGFCGSLTTLASWNSQAVRLADGSAFADSGGSQLAVALLTYILGLQTAMLSFRCGQDVAVWIFRSIHPHWAREEDLLAFAFSSGKAEYQNHGSQHHDHRHGLHKTPLTDYERHYLAFLIPQQEYRIAEQNVSALEDLEKWKISTDQFRLLAAQSSGGSGHEHDLITVLHNLERHVLLDHDQNSPIPEQWQDAVNEHGWDLAALQRFARKVHTGAGASSAATHHEATPSSPMKFHWSFVRGVVAATPFLLAVALLAVFFILDYLDVNRQYYRNMWTAALLSPLGAVLRWKLSSWNGRLRGTAWMWFPLGTFAANWTACLVSVVLSALEDSQRLVTGNEAVLAFALKAGLAGCMSTVSSYAAEGSSLQKLYPHHAKGYNYLLGTLVVTFSTGLALYSPIVRM